MKPTQQQLNWYREGYSYTFAAPPVCTVNWTQDDWAMHVDRYDPCKDTPYYNRACSALVAANQFHTASIRKCRKACAALLRRIHRYGTRQQAKDFMYHMSFVNYPLVKRPDGSWR